MDGRLTDFANPAPAVASSYASVYEVVGERKSAWSLDLDPVVAHDAPGDNYRVGAAVARYPPGTLVLALASHGTWVMVRAAYAQCPCH